MNLQPFDKTDWLCFSGAEPDDSGRTPMISYDVMVNRYEAVAVADKERVEIIVFHPSQVVVFRRMTHSYYVSVSILKSLNEDLSATALLSMNFVADQPVTGVLGY